MEQFYEDAVTASKVLGIALTKRTQASGDPDVRGSFHAMKII